MIKKYLEKYNYENEDQDIKDNNILIQTTYINENTHEVSRTIISYDNINNMYYEKSLKGKLIESHYFTLSMGSIYKITGILNHKIALIDLNKIEDSPIYDICKCQIKLSFYDEVISIETHGLSYNKSCNKDTLELVNLFEEIQQILIKHKISNKFLAI
jgi:hypothetical protein